MKKKLYVGIYVQTCYSTSWLALAVVFKFMISSNQKKGSKVSIEVIVLIIYEYWRGSLTDSHVFTGTFTVSIP